MCAVCAGRECDGWAHDTLDLVIRALEAEAIVLVQSSLSLGMLPTKITQAATNTNRAAINVTRAVIDIRAVGDKEDSGGLCITM